MCYQFPSIDFGRERSWRSDAEDNESESARIFKEQRVNRLWTALGCVLWLVGCSASAPPDRPFTPGTAAVGGPSTPVAGTTGTGAGGLGSAISNPGGPLGPVAGTTVTMVPPPPPVDPSAAPYKQDDTAMGGLDAATVGKLKAGTGACNVQITFPYENTVFPGGLIPPTIMWTGAGEAAYVRFAYEMSDKVEYEFAAKVSGSPQLQIPRTAWNEITRRTNNLGLTVTLKVMNGATVSSCPLHWKIAAGNMIGAVYYNTYQAPPPGVANNGAIMRQSLGASAEIYKQFTGQLNPIPGTGPCYSCHSVSFNGTTMVSSVHDYSLQTFHVEKFDVKAATQPTATGMLNNANFGALTPDGKRILAMGNPQCTAGSDSFPRRPNNFPLVEGAAVARMLDTQSGMDTQAKGLVKENYMWMPQFSPDGKKVVFNHAKPDGMGGSDRRELAIMDYDAASNTFSNLKVIVTASKLPGAAAPTAAYMPAPALAGVLSCGADMCSADGMQGSCTSGLPGIPGLPGDVAALPTGSCTGPCYPGWPFFTPDNNAVIFSMTSEPDFAQAFPGRDQPALSELWYVDLATLQVVRLENANKGLKDVDKLNNYYPTVMPVAVGGYFWVFWTAVRDYGSKVQGRTGGSMAAADEAIKKRIWAAAISARKQSAEFKDTTLTDPSYPGFYLDGQSESGNVRAFAALNPCLQNGASCASGLDCCCGYCVQAAGASMGTCTCEVPKCAKINEKCKMDSDCCPPERPTDPVPTCIGGYCGFVVLN
jgi:hypothetical protein